MDTSKEDVMICMPAKDGKFSVKSAYKMLTIDDRNIQVNGRIIQTSTWKALWHYRIAHKINCGICGSNLETIKHILFECNYSKRVWRGLNIDIKDERHGHNSVSEWTESWFSGNLRATNDKWLFTLMIGSWVIWKDICDVVFQGVSLNPSNFVHKINFYLNAHLHNNDMHTHSPASIIFSRWKPPMQDFNIDASFDHDTNQLGTSIVLRNFAGTCQGIKGHYADGILSPEAGECIAIRGAFLWAKELYLKKIHIEADVKLVIQSILENTLLIQ
ncbi:uncharacterized protein LOC113272634 [Papaver somniferum]|uniref:uncharacterized protein LOC113272634 n=1 Tax=Papaver somniferum TaxID=3469 RepID=UPI000E7000D8|nr:uncharacterized protein LOC113272634 [Papaver somniferum]